MNNNKRNTVSGVASSGKEGAAVHITEECERLFCETLGAVFLVERNTHQDSLVVGSHMSTSTISTIGSQEMQPYRNRMHGGPGPVGAIVDVGLATPPPDVHNLDGTASSKMPQISQWLEIYDYASDARFRGFVATNASGQRSLFVFFEHNIVGKDLKQALMALIELATTPALPPCHQMVVCFDREEEETPVTKALLRDLGWVGFELTTLSDWADGLELTSHKWLFVGMEV